MNSGLLVTIIGLAAANLAVVLRLAFQTGKREQQIDDHERRIGVIETHIF